MRLKSKKSGKGLECPCQEWEESNRCSEQEIDQRIKQAEQTNG